MFSEPEAISHDNNNDMDQALFERRVYDLLCKLFLSILQYNFFCSQN